MSDYYRNIEEALFLEMFRTSRLINNVKHQQCRIEELEEKLKKAVEALEWVKFGGGPRGESYHEFACQVLAELKDEKC